MQPDTSRWRSNSVYDFLDDLSVDGLAWECLRRNTDYQKDFAEHLKTKDETAPMNIEVERRWRLRFPGLAKPFYSHAACLLVSRR